MMCFFIRKRIISRLTLACHTSLQHPAGWSAHKQMHLGTQVLGVFFNPLPKISSNLLRIRSSTVSIQTHKQGT